jgi:hypothetical protein
LLEGCRDGDPQAEAPRGIDEPTESGCPGIHFIRSTWVLPRLVGSVSVPSAKYLNGDGVPSQGRGEAGALAFGYPSRIDGGRCRQGVSRLIIMSGSSE